MTRRKDQEATSQIEDEFFDILSDDVIAAFERQRQSPTQQNYRDLIRTIFAAIEGLVWGYRDHVVGIAKDLDRLTFEQEAALAEVGYQVSKTGKISTQARFVPLPSLFRLVTRIAVSLDPALRVRFDTGEWDRFLDVIAIRNRVTHPKSRSDLTISSQDIETSRDAFFWLFETIVQAMASANSALADRVRMLRSIFENLKAGDPKTWEEYNAAASALDP